MSRPRSKAATAFQAQGFRTRDKAASSQIVSGRWSHVADQDDDDDDDDDKP